LSERAFVLTDSIPLAALGQRRQPPISGSKSNSAHRVARAPLSMISETGAGFGLPAAWIFHYTRRGLPLSAGQGGPVHAFAPAWSSTPTAADSF